MDGKERTLNNILSNDFGCHLNIINSIQIPAMQELKYPKGCRRYLEFKQLVIWEYMDKN
jgi:hypothetical protein